MRKRINIILALALGMLGLCFSSGCAPKKSRGLHLDPRTLIEFSGIRCFNDADEQIACPAVHSHRCEVDHVALDAKTGNQVVVCK